MNNASLVWPTLVQITDTELQLQTLASFIGIIASQPVLALYSTGTFPLFYDIITLTNHTMSYVRAWLYGFSKVQSMLVWRAATASKRHFIANPKLQCIVEGLGSHKSFKAVTAFPRGIHNALVKNVWWM